LEAAQLIIDYIAPKVPEGIFLLAGPYLPQPLIKKIKKINNVKYLGYLRNLESWIKSSRICIAPILRGGGTRLKILEYAAANKPIVATFKAVEGLEMINGIHGLFYKEVNKEFIEGIRRILNDDQLAKELGKNAYLLAKKYDWKVIGERLYSIYRKHFTNM
jgi:glycosyltransferase involved in cell wall biosynthesis